MKVLPLITCVYAGLIITFGYTFVLGEAGLVNYHQLLRRRVVLEDNIESLRSINHSLGEELSNLATDSETVRLIARELGYYKADERIVDVIGMPAQRHSHIVGSLVKKATPRDRGETPYRTLLFIAPALIYAAVVFVRKMNTDGNRAR